VSGDRPFPLLKKIIERAMVSRSSKWSSNDDYNEIFLVALLLSQQSALLPLLLSQAKLKQFLSIAEVRRRDRRIPRCAFLAPGASPFMKLYKAHNEQSLITFTGLDYPSFTYLLNKFKPLYYRYSPYSSNGKILELRNRGAHGGRP
jgi:hypothetical protein